MKPHFSSFYETRPNFCIFIAFAAQFAYNSVMCWISVLAFDIWKAFSKFERRKAQLNKQKTLGIFKPKFRGYFLYSLTIPAIISIITVTLFSIPDDSFNHGAMPKLEEGLCLFSDFTFVIYRLLPSGMIMLIAVLFMSLFAYSYCCGTWYIKKGDGVETAGMMNKAKIVTRAVVLMGFIWAIDLTINVVTYTYGPKSYTNLTLQWLFAPISYLNGLWLTIAIIAHKSDIEKIKKFVVQKYTKLTAKSPQENEPGPQLIEMASMDDDATTIDLTTATTRT